MLIEDKWEKRKEMARGVVVDARGIHGLSEAAIIEWQKEFRKEFCAKCVHYDPEKKNFRETGHPNNPEDCKYHWTDIIGQCWNFKRGR